MKEGFTFNLDRLKFLRKIIFQKFWWWGENRKEPNILYVSMLPNHDTYAMDYT